MNGLSGKRVLITGGASGIGAAAVVRFLEENADVYIIDINEDASGHLKRTLPDIAGTFVADVAHHGEVARAFTEMDELCGGIDVLINNAGISIRHRFLEITVEDWRRVIDVNLNGIFFVAQQAAKRMSAQGSGVIINTASTNGVVGYPYYCDYNASKAGVIELSKSMALELAPEVRVLAVCPGYVQTPMQEAEYTPEMLEEINNKLPLRRHARPEEVASLFAYLASEEAAYITGHTYVIDGGEIAGGLASR